MQRQAGNVSAEEMDAAAGRAQRAGQNVEERALAGAVRPDDAAELLLADRQVQSFEGLQPSEADADIFGLEQDVAHQACLLPLNRLLSRA